MKPLSFMAVFTLFLSACQSMNASDDCTQLDYHNGLTGDECGSMDSAEMGAAYMGAHD